MRTIELAINEPFAAPAPGANWVIFSDGQCYESEENTPRMLSRAVRYAKKYNVYLIPGKFIREGRVCMCIISPGGEPLLGQEGIFLNLSRRGELSRGESVDVAETPFGKIALGVDVDICHPAYVKALAGLGAEVVFSSRYLEIFDATENRIKAPILSASISSPMYVVGITNAGSCIAGPEGRLILPVRDMLSMKATLQSRGLKPDNRRLAAGRRLMDKFFETWGGLTV